MTAAVTDAASRGLSLGAKLTLAFVAVAVAGALLLALFVGFATRRAFDRYVVDRAEASAIEALAAFYAAEGSWEGVESVLATASVAQDAGLPLSPDGGPADGPWRQPPGAGLVLVGTDGRVIAGGPGARGGAASGNLPADALPVEVDGETVAYVVGGRHMGPGRGRSSPQEAAFLSRVTRAIGASALGAAALAVVMGWALSRAIVRPVGDLTAAMRAVAGGEFGLQVTSRGGDEIAELSRSFNQMSSDLEKGRRLRRQMTADIAHDLRTPLTVIAGYSEGLVDGRFEGSPETYQALREEAVHLQHLVEDLRTLSLADAGELPLQRSTVDPVDLLRGVAARLSPAAAQKGVAIQVAAPDPVGDVDVDRERMAQVLANLVANAVRHTPAGGTVTLRAEASGGGVTLGVRDDGEGIAPEDLPHVFERHYRADRSRAVADGASGLGLAIARSIVEAHGGTIRIDSVLGEGTLVAVLLPTPRPA